MPGVNESAGNTVTFVQTTDQFEAGSMDSVTQYNGSATQAVDSLMVTAEGAGKVPAYRGTTYVVIKNLKITKWGGSLPGFEALVQEKETKTIAEAIGDLLERNGRVTSDDYDVSAVTGNIQGLVQMGLRAPIDGLRSLMFAYDIETQFRGVVGSDGVFRCVLTFFPKASAEERTVEDDDRGARAAGDQGDDLLAVIQTDDQSLPSEVSITFTDPDREHQPGTRTFRKSVFSSDNQTRVSLPMTLTADDALKLAKKLMWQNHTNERTRIELRLPPSYIDLAESDIVVVNDHDGEELKARVTQVDRGNNALIKVDAMREHVGVYTQSADAETQP